MIFRTIALAVFR